MVPCLHSSEYLLIWFRIKSNFRSCNTKYNNGLNYDIYSTYQINRRKRNDAACHGRIHAAADDERGDTDGRNAHGDAHGAHAADILSIFRRQDHDSLDDEQDSERQLRPATPEAFHDFDFRAACPEKKPWAESQQQAGNDRTQTRCQTIRLHDIFATLP